MVDRVERASYFFDATRTFGFFDYLYGLGLNSEMVHKKHFTAGALSLVYESGILGLASLLIFSLLIFEFDIRAFALFLVLMFSFEPFKLPLIWIMLVLISMKPVSVIDNSYAKNCI